jgi:hypothetical protein
MAKEVEAKAAAKTWQDWLAEVKAGWGISGDEIDKKLAKLLIASDNDPQVEELARLVRSFTTPASMELAILTAVTEWKELIATGKSVVKKNRSALA